MKKHKYILLTGIFLLSLYGVARGGTVKSEEENDEIPATISIVLLGRKGAGITSTVRQLMGPKVTIHTAEVAVASTDILEYTLRLQQPPGKRGPIYLKLVDVPGLELADNSEHDAEILSTLKSYLHDKGLPTFFLVVYRFDEKQIAQADSQLRQLLKRVECFQRALYQTTTDNIAFLLTRLLSEPSEVQKAPGERINEFRRVIQESLLLPSPAEIIVGDNKPDSSTVQMEKGFIKLPNGELYPKNIWDGLLKVLDHSQAISQQDKEIVKNGFATMIDNRETAQLHTKELVAHATDEDTFESDLEAFEYLLRQSNFALPKNDIQSFLQLTYENQDATTQIASSAQLLALQICLRHLRLETIEQVPQTLAGVVKLFQQDMEGVLTYKYSLFYIKKALDLDVPEYPTQNLIVGYGYDLVHDRLLRKTPFLRTPSKRPSSSLGYQFPDYMECEKLPISEEVVLANSTETPDQYHEERLKYLTLPDREDIVLSQLKGESQAYLNLKPVESGKLAARKEFRVLECKMTVDNDSIAIIDDNFVSAVNVIPTLNTSCEESVANWKLFIYQYGTHVITKSFGGGCYQGTLFIPSRENANMANKEKVAETLSTIANFGDVSTLTTGDAAKLLYEFHVDDGLDIRATHINLLSEAERSKILNEWQRNLNYRFEMLTNELELVPLSQIVSIVNSDKGKDAATAIKLLFQGKLVAQPGVAGAAADDSEVSKITRAKGQTGALKWANLEKITEKYNQLNEFLDGVTG